MTGRRLGLSARATDHAFRSTRWCTRLAAIVAIYALALQAVLGAASAAAAVAPGHDLVLCTPSAAGGGTPAAPVSSHRHDCCRTTGRATAPPQVMFGLAEPAAIALAVVYDEAQPFSPPTRQPITGSARGPPLS